MITIKKKAEVKKQYIFSLQFGKAVKVVEKYWDIGSSLVYMTYCIIGHQWMRSCKDLL